MTVCSHVRRQNRIVILWHDRVVGGQSENGLSVEAVGGKAAAAHRGRQAQNNAERRGIARTKPLRTNDA